MRSPKISKVVWQMNMIQYLTLFLFIAGAHTIGYAQCFTFKTRLFNFQASGKPDPTLDASVLNSLQSMCSNIDSSNSNLAPLDSASTYRFDNMYYTNLVNNMGLLESDQALMRDPKTAAMVNSYSTNSYLFWNDFGTSMAKLGNWCTHREKGTDQKQVRVCELIDGQDLKCWSYVWSLYS